MSRSIAELQRLATEKNRRDYEGSQNLAPFLGWGPTPAEQAAEAVALEARRLAGIARELAVLRWMVGANVILALAILAQLLRG